MRSALPVLVLALGLAACQSAEDARRERGDEIEQVYGLAPADARLVAGENPELATSRAESLFRELAPALGMKRLWPDDVRAFAQIVALKADERDKLVAGLEGEKTVELVNQLGETFGYEPRFREAGALVDAAEHREKLGATFGGDVKEAIALIRARQPFARVPLDAVAPLSQLAGLSTTRIAAALDRFAELQVDLGVRELDPRSIDLLARIAREPQQGDALASLQRNLPALQVARIDPAALSTIGAVPSNSLAYTLDRLGATRAWRALAAFEQPAADYIRTLARRPGSASLLVALEESNPDFQAASTVREAEALVKIEAASPTGDARDALATILRARVAVDALDDEATAFLVALVSRQPLREAVTALHSAFAHWQPTPAELPALELVVGNENLGPVARALRTLGYELAERPLAKGEAAALASLAKAPNTLELIEGLHVVLPRLSVRNAASLGELDALAKSGVTRDDVLRLDADSISGPLDPTRRGVIADKVRKIRKAG